MRADMLEGRTSEPAVVRVEGESDLDTAVELNAALDRAAATFPQAVICDLTGVTFFAVAGIRCLERASNELMLVGEHLHVVVDDSVAARLPAMLPAPLGWTAHPTMDAAPRSVALPG